MPKPRSALVSLEATPYYHCVSRCVRRAFLCGVDSFSGQSYEHRRGWVEEKLLSLPEKTFAIQVCAYAVMSNHYHVVLWVDKAQAEAWTEEEVAERWHQLFNGNPLSQRFLRGEALSPAELKVLRECIETWRERLMDISWFMRVLNEAIARQANAEDGCSGRFWEGRFKSQALLDEKALAACMAYVDLNPIRAGMAKTPEDSDHTSIQRRSQQAQQVHSPNHPKQQVKTLQPFVGNPRADMPTGLPFRLTDYLELVDATGRILREDKRGHIPESALPILERLNIEPKHWLYLSRNFESCFKGLVGSAYTLKAAASELGYQRAPGSAACRQLLT